MMLKNHTLFWKYVSSQSLNVEVLTGERLQSFSVSPAVLRSIVFAHLNFTIFLYILWHDATTYQMVSCYVPDSGLRIVILDIHHMCLHILLFIQCNIVAFLGGIFSYICGFVPIKINKRII